MQLPTPITRTEAQFLYQFQGGQPEGLAMRDLVHTVFNVVPTLESFMEGVGQGNITRDTDALAMAMTAGAHVRGHPNVDFYYIAQGTTCAAGARLTDIRLKAKLGPDGFSSKSWLVATRYDVNHLMLYWNDVDGGGWHNLEIFGDGGGDYVCMGVSAKLGFTTRPLIGTGYLYIHDIPFVSGAVTLNGIGPAGYDINMIKLENGGTAQPVSYWSGSPSFVQVTGLGIDGDTLVNSAKGHIGTIIGKNIHISGVSLLDHGDQSDLITIQGASRTPVDNGPAIDLVISDGVNEVFDIQTRGVRCKEIQAFNTSGQVWKLVHGANRTWCGHIYSEKCALAIVGVSGSNTQPVDEEYNRVDSITGKDQGSYYNYSGTLVSATATTFTLPSDASSIDDIYNGNFIRLASGAGANITPVDITDYDGATKTGTVASWPSGTPDNTTVVRILPFQFSSVVSIAANGTVSNPKNNVFVIDGVEDGGDLSYLTDFHSSTLGQNNKVVVNRDLGYQGSSPTSMQSAAGYVVAGQELRSVAKIYLANAQTITDTNAHVLLFDTSTVDSYQQTGAATGVQVDTTSNGIRAKMSGDKEFCIQLRGSGGSSGMAINVVLKRNTTQIAAWDWITAGTGTQSRTFTTHTYHPETGFGSGNENLYTVTVTHSNATSWTYSANAVTTTFSMRG